MGLFDSWRRKKAQPTPSLQKSPEKHRSTEGNKDSSNALLSEYNILIQRRAELQKEREELTSRLERGEIDSDAFRKELMNRIQEAATVSEKIQTIATKLTSLGYRGVHS